MLSLLACLGACGDRNASGQDGSPADVAARAVDLAPDHLTVDQPCACILKVATINGRSAETVTTLIRTNDPIVVVVTGTCVPDGAEITLQGTAETPDPVVKAQGGAATFRVMKLSPTPGLVTLSPAATGCTGKNVTLLMDLPPQCFFISPKDGSKVNTGPVDVTIGTINAAGGTVTLKVDQSVYGPALSPDAKGEVGYKQVKISMGTTVFSAVVQANSMQGTCTATIANCGCGLSCAIKGFTPPAMMTSYYAYFHGLGAAQSTASGSTSVTTTVTVETDGTDVVLVDTVSGQTWSKPASSGKANLQVTLLNGKRVLDAKCTDVKDGRTANSPSYMILVDAAPPPAVSDLSCVGGPAAGQITCSWTGVKDNIALGDYDLRYVINGPISTANFAAAFKTAPVAAGSPGAKVSATISGLKASDSHAFAVRSVDVVSNHSAISNLPAATKPK